MLKYAIALFLAVFSIGPSLRAADFDKRLAGRWTITVANKFGKWLSLWDIQEDGSYTLSSKGTSPLPTETGKLAAADGKYGLWAVGGRKDSGTYELKGKDQLVLVNAKGEKVFKLAAPAAHMPENLTAKMEAGSFEAVRQAADKIAFKVSPKFKLFRVDVEKAQPMTFHYYSPNNKTTGVGGAWVIMKVNSGPQGAAIAGQWSGSDELGYPFSEPVVSFPAHLVSPKDAMEKLGGKGLILNLLSVGTEPSSETTRSYFENAETQYVDGFAVDMRSPADRKDLLGRWVWRLMATKQVSVADTSAFQFPGKTAPAGGGHHHTENQPIFRYIDAGSGEAL